MGTVTDEPTIVETVKIPFVPSKAFIVTGYSLAPTGVVGTGTGPVTVRGTCAASSGGLCYF